MTEKSKKEKSLLVKKLGIDTYLDNIIYVRKDCHICSAEGFDSHARVKVSIGNRFILATLNFITSDLLKPGEAGLSDCAWGLLEANDGNNITISHPDPLYSLSYVRSKVYGHELSQEMIKSIMEDVYAGKYSDLYIAEFLTACSDNRLSKKEIVYLTKAMIDLGKKLSWGRDIIVDKHCVGGLPGNRTTLIVVPIVAQFGLLIPKTSSRAITSPSGTADTMEVFARVDLDVKDMRRVVELEKGCIIWGGAVNLSPVDDILIRVERALQIDSEGQVVASVLSKKFAAGSNYTFLDIPIGPTAKVRTIQSAERLKKNFEHVGKEIGIKIKTIFSDGRQPIGRGIGPVLEANDVLSVLQNRKDQPLDLRGKALDIAAQLIEFSPNVKFGEGQEIAKHILDSGKAWKKFQAICDAQGGMRDLKLAKYKYVVEARVKGKILDINNRKIAHVAKLAGAPNSKAAGVEMQVKINDNMIEGQPLFTIHSETHSELEYSKKVLTNDIIEIKET
jgi:thymidine phosphorylase